MRFLGYVIIWAFVCGGAQGEEPIEYNRDIRPILAENCWQCHGFDAQARKGNLRLDVRAEALVPAASGERAIVAGDPELSEMLVRITSNDEELRMPPARSGKTISPSQIQTLRKWIQQGASYQRHWAFEPPIRANIPHYSDCHNPIDCFIQEKLNQFHLQTAQSTLNSEKRDHDQGSGEIGDSVRVRKLAREANRDVLRRRVSIDLTGLPPSSNDLDQTDELYEHFVDRLLASPHFGERLAVDWLDAARYADTNGYFSDQPREMWLWRNWVIDAFNRNQPFDQFTIEQIAGDLIPHSTTSQKIATGFNRNHMANNETGIVDEEFRTEYVIDRVDTTMTTWMGITAACAQCHDHKYDPISQREFYGIFAYFNNIAESGLASADNPPPVITVSTEEQDQFLKQLQNDIATAESRFEPWRPSLQRAQLDWEAKFQESQSPLPEARLVLHEAFHNELGKRLGSVGTNIQFQRGIRNQAGKFDATQHAECSQLEFSLEEPWTIGFWILPDGSLGCPISKIESKGRKRGFEVIWQKGRLKINLVANWGIEAIEVITREKLPAGDWHHVVICFDGVPQANNLRAYVNGQPIKTDIQRDTLRTNFNNREPIRIGRRDEGLGYYGLLDELRIIQHALTDREIADWYYTERIQGVLELDVPQRSSKDTEFVQDYYINQFAPMEVRDIRKQLQAARVAATRFRKKIPTALVMEERPQARVTRVLERGQYDQPGEIVTPGVPKFLSELPLGAPANRLGFAQWLVSRNNPLTARVLVNRLWKQCFGEGLVRTMNDFGTQGEPPSHPELLDWLAVDLQDYGWDIKRLLKLIVTSRTYRQDSSFRLQNNQIFDPQNRLFARGPSFRMSAEMIRDQALAVSGLLHRRIGGPSVKPYQPPGLWEEVSYNADETYVPDSADGLWRRSLYTFVKRQSPPPMLLTFDGPTREKCIIQRARTNTPIQSLLLLNDSTFVEAAAHLAANLLKSPVPQEKRLEDLFQTVLSRRHEQRELQILEGLLARQRLRFEKDREQVHQLLPSAISHGASHSQLVELAAWTVVAHTLLNLDEVVTRR